MLHTKGNLVLCAELCFVMEGGCLAEGKICSIKPDALLMTRHKTNQKQVDAKPLSETFKVTKLWLKNLVRKHHTEG